MTYTIRSGINAYLSIEQEVRLRKCIDYLNSEKCPESERAEYLPPQKRSKVTLSSFVRAAVVSSIECVETDLWGSEQE